jgi:hypothetical protein
VRARPKRGFRTTRSLAGGSPEGAAAPSREYCPRVVARVKEISVNKRLRILAAATAVAFLATGTLSTAEEQAKPPMHMHKSNMDHRSDKEVAIEYQDEATQLREQAQSHRELAQAYRARTAGKVNYGQIAKHCDNLAKFYEDAAREAESISSDLKQ